MRPGWRAWTGWIFPLWALPIRFLGQPRGPMAREAVLLCSTRVRAHWPDDQYNNNQVLSVFTEWLLQVGISVIVPKQPPPPPRYSTASLLELSKLILDMALKSWRLVILGNFSVCAEVPRIGQSWQPWVCPKWFWAPQIWLGDMSETQ